MKKLCSITLVLGMLCTMLAIPSFANENDNLLTNAIEVEEADNFKKEVNVTKVELAYNMSADRVYSGTNGDYANRWTINRMGSSPDYTPVVLSDASGFYFHHESEAKEQMFNIIAHTNAKVSQLNGTIVYELNMRFGENSAFVVTYNGSIKRLNGSEYTGNVYAYYPAGTADANEKYLIGNGSFAAETEKNYTPSIKTQIEPGKWVNVKIVGTPRITSDTTSEFEWEYFIENESIDKGIQQYSGSLDANGKCPAGNRADCLKKLIIYARGEVDIKSMKLYRVFKSPALEAVSTEEGALKETVIKEGANSIILDFDKPFAKLGTVKVNDETVVPQQDVTDASKYTIPLLEEVQKNSKLDIVISGEDTIIENVARYREYDKEEWVEEVAMGENITIPVYVANENSLYIEKNDENVIFVNGGNEANVQLIKAVYTSSDKSELARIDFVKNSTIATGRNDAISISGGALNGSEYAQLFIWENNTLKPLDK